MSSHHIVRDEQEPALLIANPSSIHFEIIQNLLEWSPTVVVDAHHLDEVLTWGIKIDVVIGKESDRPDLIEKVQSQAPVQVLGFTKPQFLSDALIYLSAKKHQAANVMGILPELGQAPDSILPLVYFYNKSKYFFVPDGQYEKWLKIGSIITIHALSPIETQGLIQIDTNYKALADGIVKVRSEVGFWVEEELAF